MARSQVLQCGRFRFGARRRVGSFDKASTSAKGPGVAAPSTLEPPCDRNSVEAGEWGSEDGEPKKRRAPRGCPRPYRPQPSSAESSTAHPGPPSCRTFGVAHQLTPGHIRSSWIALTFRLCPRGDLSSR
jgi:hypothetical protein